MSESTYSCFFVAKFVTFNIPLTYPFRRWPLRMTPHMHRSFLIFATYILTTLFLVSGTVSVASIASPIPQQSFKLYRFTLADTSCYPPVCATYDDVRDCKYKSGTPISIASCVHCSMFATPVREYASRCGSVRTDSSMFT